MLNNKAIICVALVSALALTNIKIPKQHIQKPSVKVMSVRPKTDIKVNKLKDQGNIKYYIKQIPLSKSLQKYTYDICAKNKISYTLILAVMYKESNFKANLICKDSNLTQDFGLLQINTCNLQWVKDTYHITDVLNAKNNIKSGVGLIANNINKYGRDENSGLIAYNLGDDGFRKLKRKGYSSTYYSRTILSKKTEYQKLIT